MNTAQEQSGGTLAADELTIAEVCGRLGMTLRAARFYESRGLIAPRRRGRQRIYSSGEFKRIETILAMKRFGFTLVEIRKLLESSTDDHRYPLTAQQCEKQIAFLEARLKEVEHTIAELRVCLTGDAAN